MGFNETPKANRLHVGFFGRRNAGKSSVLNLITDQPVSITSGFAGTTTDPVYKNMEINPLGAVTFIDTAGFDDEGELGALRVSRTKEVLSKTDVSLLVVGSDMVDDLTFERSWRELFAKNALPVVVVLNKCDLLSDKERESMVSFLRSELSAEVVSVSTLNNTGRFELISAIIRNAPEAFESDTLTGDLYNQGDVVVLVMPQDIQAPKGRLILPQVQVVRDILDNKAMPFCTTTDNLQGVLASLNTPPALVITDSQVFKEVNSMVSKNVPLTSFSIIMARSKGDLSVFVRGASAIKNLTENSRVLIAESCTHAPLTEDIGREKIPALLRSRVGNGISFDVATGLTFPDNLKSYDLILHCGGCMFTRKQLMSRLVQAESESVPITNYGVAMAELSGILNRVTEMFQELK
ncbi:MAG: [FeFe] hydrogenase H-cluster maturation GTPase HydF [Synergistaceae bacterium]